MKVFVPHSTTILILIICIFLFVVLIGYAITRFYSGKIAMGCSWLIFIAATVSIERVCSDEPPGFRMVAVILVMLYGMKVVATAAYYKSRRNRLSFVQWLCFVAGWVGMRPSVFETLGGRPLPGARRLILFGLSRVAIGAVVLLFMRTVRPHPSNEFLATLYTFVVLAALSLILHFGFLNISAGFWRTFGADTRMLFKAPLLSTTLTEFWGKRWNLAFSEMTSIAIYRPLKPLAGVRTATFIAFLFSGLLHEMAISIPVKAGYGLPMLYFVLHGLLMLSEKSLSKIGVEIGKNEFLGRLWIIFWLVVPLPLLFHKYFLNEIIFPLIGI